MRQVLGRKSTSKNSDWLKALANIQSLVSEQEVDDAVNNAVDDIKTVCAGKEVAYGWSGGKDSMVLRYICEKAGIKKSFLGLSELDFPEFRQWCLQNAPAGCTIIETPRTYQFLKEHPNCLFPNHKDRDAGSTMLIYGPQWTFKRYFELYPETDIILVGHRTLDGNIPGRSNMLRNSKGVVRYSPIAKWTHELILATMVYKGLPFAPNYFYYNGFVNGTHCWNDTVGIDTIEQGWRYVWGIDKSIVHRAAEYDIQGARQWLTSHTE